ncbi:nucleotide-diphospho-sugar transferase [Leucogyrophana mollusca]|uniref:Nucleotide-diphospho-sugar transferase n=1 Tax=Leucogyrophana mollusca TaxID=85980 RepID=A0ACB8BCY8_9AGAM|nr:nucleotide-diphospho-sugar transferase [Leucogyrophana mollusca]
MAPKSSSSAKEKLIGEEEEVLQAVILADSFNKRFKPLTTHKPRCLLPICNAPLLDWTFESLALAGVQEIFVICRSHADLVKAAIKNSKWSKPNAGLKIVPIVTAKETFSPGDAMRDIYTHGIITSDFVLVTGDLVSNVRIDEVVRQHKERRKTNKDAIMTMVVKESGAMHRTRSRGDSAVFVLDAETSECLHYEAVTGYPPKKYASIPREILAEHPEVEIRNDLIDCSIDVCSVEVPSLFQDNFDYGDLRRDFVHGILTSDLLMKNIYCYIAKEGYAARVKDTRSYDSVSKDILSRWTFPLVPDDNHPGGHSYEHLRGNKYIAKDNSVVLSRTCKIGNNTLIGSKSQIADNAQISASVLGQRCIIGAGSIIRNSYLFEGVVIGANCVIEHSIIGADVQIREGGRVAKGCLIADGVSLGPQARLSPFERLSKRRQEESDGDDEDENDEGGADGEDAEADDGEDGDDEDEGEEEDEDSELEEVEANQDPEALAKLGEGTNAIIWPPPTVDDDEEVDELENPDNQRLMRIGDEALDLVLSDPGSVTSSESESESDSDEYDELYGVSNASSSATSLPLSVPTNLVAQADSAAITEFQNEVTQSLERAFAEDHSVDNAAVELKTLRMASNVPLRRVREAVVAAIVNRIKIVEGGNVPQRKEIATVIDRWGGLIDKIGGVDAVETVEVLQAHCASSDRLPLFGQILAALYQDDIVEEDDIRSWHAMPSSQGEDVKSTSLRDNFKKCWNFDEQESDDESSEEEETKVTAKVEVEEESEEESDSDDSEAEAKEPPAATAAAAAPTGAGPPPSTSGGSKGKAESEGSDEDEEDEDEDEDESEEANEAPAATTSIAKDQGLLPPNTTEGKSKHESEESEDDDEDEDEDDDEEGEEDEEEEDSDEQVGDHKRSNDSGKP